MLHLTTARARPADRQSRQKRKFYVSGESFIELAKVSAIFFTKCKVQQLFSNRCRPAEIQYEIKQIAIQFLFGTLIEDHKVTNISKIYQNLTTGSIKLKIWRLQKICTETNVKRSICKFGRLLYKIYDISASGSSIFIWFDTMYA